MAWSLGAGRPPVRRDPRQAGIDVQATRGRCGGYRLGRATTIPPVVLTGDEALGMAMVALVGRPADDGSRTSSTPR